MTRNLNSMFGMDVQQPKSGIVARHVEMWTPEDQREFLAAIPIVAARHNALVMPDGNSFPIEDVGSISLLLERDGRWLAGICREDGLAALAAFHTHRDAVDTMTAWMNCWTASVQRNTKKGEHNE